MSHGDTLRNNDLQSIGIIKSDTRRFWRISRIEIWYFNMGTIQNFSHTGKSCWGHKGDFVAGIQNKKIVRFRIVEGILIRAMAELCHCYSWHT